MRTKEYLKPNKKEKKQLKRKGQRKKKKAKKRRIGVEKVCNFIIFIQLNKIV
jgi:hypothetical protein